VRRPLALALVAVVAAGPACSSGAEPVVVEFGEVTSGEVVQIIAAPAVVQPAGRRVVLAPAAGEVVDVLIEDGASVEAGAAVLQLSSDAIALAIEQAEAAVDAADTLAAIPAVGDLSPIFADVRAQLDDVIPSLLDSLDAQVAVVPDEAVRAVIAARIDEARAAYDATSEQLASAEAAAASAQDAATEAQLEAAEAQSDQAQLALDAARERADSLAVVAPVAGRVELAPATAGVVGGLGGLASGDEGTDADRVGPGTVVSAGQPLFTVYDLSEFHVEAAIDEVDAVLVTTGQVADVLVDAFPDSTFVGTVRRVGVGPTRSASGGTTYPAVIELEPSDAPFRVGLTASVEIVVRRVDADVVVPSRALLRREGRDVVLAARDGVVVEVEVEVVALGDETAAVEGELRRGEQLIIAGFEELQDGDPLP